MGLEHRRVSFRRTQLVCIDLGLSFKFSPRFVFGGGGTGKYKLLSRLSRAVTCAGNDKKPEHSRRPWAQKMCAGSSKRWEGKFFLFVDVDMMIQSYMMMKHQGKTCWLRCWNRYLTNGAATIHSLYTAEWACQLACIMSVVIGLYSPPWACARLLTAIFVVTYCWFFGFSVSIWFDLLYSITFCSQR